MTDRETAKKKLFALVDSIGDEEPSEEAKKLLLAIDTANDPAAKSDLLNRIAVQQSALQANRNMVALMEQRQKQELEVANRALADDIACKEFGRKDCSGSGK